MKRTKNKPFIFMSIEFNCCICVSRMNRFKFMQSIVEKTKYCKFHKCMTTGEGNLHEREILLIIILHTHKNKNKYIFVFFVFETQKNERKKKVIITVRFEATKETNQKEVIVHSIENNKGPIQMMSESQ